MITHLLNHPLFPLIRKYVVKVFGHKSPEDDRDLWKFEVLAALVTQKNGKVVGVIPEADLLALESIVVPCPKCGNLYHPIERRHGKLNKVTGQRPYTNRRYFRITCSSTKTGNDSCSRGPKASAAANELAPYLEQRKSLSQDLDEQENTLRAVI